MIKTHCQVSTISMIFIYTQRPMEIKCIKIKNGNQSVLLCTNIQCKFISYKRVTAKFIFDAV